MCLAALTELTCVGVLVGYTAAPRLGTCVFNTGSEIPVGQFGGLVPYTGSGASEIRVQDLIGDQQIDVYAVGFKTSDYSCAKLVPGVDPKEGTSAEYSEPYVLGSISGFLAGGKNNFFPEISANFNSNYRVDDCRGPLFNKDSVLRDGLVAFWNFDSNNVNTTNDLTGAFDLVSNSSSHYDNGNNNGLNGSGNWVQSTAAVAIESTGNSYFNITGKSISFSFWVKKFGTPGTGTLLKKIDSNKNIIVSYGVSSSDIKVAVSGNTPVSCPGVTSSEYNHYVVSLESVLNTATHILRIFRNGIKCGSDSTESGTGSYSASNFQVGDASTGAIDIRFDSLGVWRRPLREFEAKAIYNNGLGKEYPFE
jgi:hypothetical protein